MVVNPLDTSGAVVDQFNKSRIKRDSRLACVTFDEQYGTHQVNL